MSWKRVIFLVAASAIVTGGLILSKTGHIAPWIGYALLIVLHVWIFTKIGIRIYNLINKKNEKENCCR